MKTYILLILLITVLLQPTWSLSLPRLFRTENNPELGALFEGDIILPMGDVEVLRAAIREPSSRWPHGIVNYVIDPNFEGHEVDMLREAFSEFESKSCVRWVEGKSRDGFVYIQKVHPEGGCSSHVGHMGGRQLLKLSPRCFVMGILLHEMMHTLGFRHEQARYDRDEYVTINWENIRIGTKYNFMRYSDRKITHQGTDYDYESVMHYGPFGFARDQLKPTLVPKHADLSVIGQRRGFSETDLVELNKLYYCGDNGTKV